LLLAGKSVLTVNRPLPDARGQRRLIHAAGAAVRGCLAWVLFALRCAALTAHASPWAPPQMANASGDMRVALTACERAVAAVVSEATAAAAEADLDAAEAAAMADAGLGPALGGTSCRRGGSDGEGEAAAQRQRSWLVGLPQMAATLAAITGGWAGGAGRSALPPLAASVSGLVSLAAPPAFLLPTPISAPPSFCSFFLPNRPP
jgi:hypothetical protein